ncbi:MAG: hypothetical protein Q4E53_09155 [Eubacteriales bacterium]|nr:hypothetical protein [Eubacteriales bacterium]
MENLLLVGALVFIGTIGFIIAKKTNLFVKKEREDRIIDDIFSK